MKIKNVVMGMIMVLTLSNCHELLHYSQSMPKIKFHEPVEAVGYSSIESYKRYPPEQQKLLAIRAAKLDAYRNLAEELYGVRIKGNTTVKDLVIENDNYRVYINGILKGAHLSAITPKGNGVYEAEVELRFNDYMYNCILNPHHGCYASGGRNFTIATTNNNFFAGQQQQPIEVRDMEE